MTFIEKYQNMEVYYILLQLIIQNLIYCIHCQYHHIQDCFYDLCHPLKYEYYNFCMRLALLLIFIFKENKQKFADSRRSLIQALYHFMGRGIFKSDRIKFVMHLVHKMFPEQIPDEV